MAVLRLLLYRPHVSTKRLPWAALLCLLAAYAMSGKFLAELPVVWLDWEIAIIGVLVAAMMHIRSPFHIKQWFAKSLRSDILALALLTIAAALLSVVLLWLHIFL